MEEEGWGFDVLPNETILFVFEFLPLDSVINCSLVCRNWAAVLGDSSKCEWILSSELTPPPPQGFWRRKYKLRWGSERGPIGHPMVYNDWQDEGMKG